jgi:hypothetical protein
MIRRSPPKWLLKLESDPFGAIPWMEMFLTLPLGGVQEAFPDPAICAARLAVVRWPKGVRCLSCGTDDVGFVEKRDLYQCRTCRRQFSVTTETVAHRSRFDLRLWFIFAEEIISAYATRSEDTVLVGHGIADRYGISYAAAHRLKTSLTKSLSEPGGGLIGACICVRSLPVTRDPGLSTEEWHRKLLDAML